MTDWLKRRWTSAKQFAWTQLVFLLGWSFGVFFGAMTTAHALGVF